MLIIAATVAFGQSPFEHKFAPDPRFAILEHGSRSVLSVPDTTSRRPFDVISYSVLLDWRNPFKKKTQIFSGSNEITIKVTSKTSAIVLDATEMHIDTMWINGVMSPTPPQPDANQTLTIPLVETLRDSTKLLILKFAYTRTSSTNDGMYFYPQGEVYTSWLNTVDTVEEDLAYTMSEPLDAHKWMPCMDLPYQKSASQMAIIVPVGYTAQSNGFLDSTKENDDYSTTFYWRSDRPISTYLMVANASKWIQWTDYYHRLSNPLDSVAVTYYAWPADYNGNSRYNAKAALLNTPLMVKAFSALFGEYPFEKYGQVPVDPFAYGGMEHQTITTIAREWFISNRYEDGIAHELMHQWFGDKTTCETWADIWLNEGFATHGEGLWEEAKNGKAAYDNAMAWYARGFFVDASENNIPVYGPPLANIFDYATTYCKAGCVLYMLRKVVNNDTLFFHALRDYSTQFAYSTATTAEWIDFMSRRLSMDLTEFTDQWLYSAGYPNYAIQWGQKTDSALVIQVRQTQGIVDHYTMPMSFIIYHGALADTMSLASNSRSQQFVFNLPYAVDSVMFDSSSVVISLHTTTRNNALSVTPVVTASNTSIKLQLQLGNSSIECHFLPLTGNGTIELYNTLGEKVYESNLSAGTSNFNLPTGQLANAAYFVRLRSAFASQTGRIGVIR
jgi:aminopeptidase N